MPFAVLLLLSLLSANPLSAHVVARKHDLLALQTLGACLDPLLLSHHIRTTIYLLQVKDTHIPFLSLSLSLSLSFSLFLSLSLFLSFSLSLSLSPSFSLSLSLARLLSFSHAPLLPCLSRLRAMSLSRARARTLFLPPSPSLSLSLSLSLSPAFSLSFLHGALLPPQPHLTTFSRQLSSVFNSPKFSKVSCIVKCIVRLVASERAAF